MYSIYKGLKPNGEWKVGCDSDYPNRPLSQNLTNYFILEQHEDIMVASKRELELQKEHGVAVDRIPYYQSIESSHKGGSVRGASENNNFKNYTHEQWKEILKNNGGHNKKLTDSQVLEIRNRYSNEKISLVKLAKEYGVSNKTIHRVVRKEVYKHVT